MEKLEFLKNEPAPKVFKIAYDLLGTREFIGSANNPIIITWAKELGLMKSYTADSIPWCGLFVAYCVDKAGFDVVKSPLWARNWANFGTKVKVAMLGDILTFVRDGGGHVGIYVGENKNNYFVLGGNQGDKVSIVEIAKNRCISKNRCNWKTKQPENIRQIFIDFQGEVSTNEK